ncbi:MAG: hypothetical protein QOJ52_4306 [Acidimicrobiaceae bacterium]|jgi:Tfp pilus assembly protein PilE|nr:hypothetical protein [Acidimicrobiaceae bacterium]
MWMPGWRRGSHFNIVEFLVVVAIAAVLVGTIAYSTAGISRESQTSACEADTRSLRNAEEANFAQLGAYETQDELFDHGLLSHVSTWHGVTLIPADRSSHANDYRITVLGDRCGSDGHEVGETAADR